MGLDNFNVAPDNKGGRKKKPEEQESEARKFSGDPYVESKVDEDWWTTVIGKTVGLSKLNQNDYDEFWRASMEVADHVHLQTINVWLSWHKHDVLDIDWEWLKDQTPDEYVDARWPGESVGRGTSSTTLGSSSKSNSAGEGLSSIIDAAK